MTNDGNAAILKNLSLMFERQVIRFFVQCIFRMHKTSYLFNCFYNFCADAEIQTHFLHIQVYDISSVWLLTVSLTQLPSVHPDKFIE